MTTPLHPLTLPLVGQHLIEASAGTGKTWTIASLYLRLVLGLGGPTGRALRPHEILVLTFTRAATRELVDRIRARLVQARDVFAGSVPAPAADRFLGELLAEVAPGAARHEAAWRLEQAATGMDDAAVMTIDAWVQRLLTDHVWPPGHPGPEQLLEKDEHWITQSVHDYWRQQVYPLDDAAMQAVADVASGPQELASWLAAALRSPHAAPPMGSASLQAMLNPIAGPRATALTALKAGWLARADAIEDWFSNCLHSNPKFFNGTFLKGGMRTVRRWCHEIRTWAAGPSCWLEGVNAGKAGQRQLRDRLTNAGLMRLHSKTTRPADESGLPAWASAFEELVAGLDALTQVHEPLGLHALAWVANHLAQTKRQRSAFTFDDLLQQATTHLKQRPSVAHAIADQFPVAMVDEFQDTSPDQLTLFELVYPEQRAHEHALLLIGDPKQSIYGFRGADIHSYLTVRRRLAQRVHALDCNRRSVAPLVNAVNQLFQLAEQRVDGASALGAFLHGAEVPFESVRSEGPQGRLVQGEEALPVLCAWTEHVARPANELRKLNATRAAERMARMLHNPKIGFLQPDGHFTRLRPKDCCVLVRSRTEAMAMGQALRDEGLASVYLSERDSILESSEARDVLDLLHALLNPRDLSLVRRVWASASMGLSLAQQLSEAGNEALWDRRVERLQEVAGQWRREGLLAALRHFMRSEHISDRANPGLGGERLVTNWLHLAEWLESLASRATTPSALVQAYAEWIADPQKALESTPGLRDATLLRLESEEDVVQIVTIHKSKGLQYPVVWMPFAVGHREDKKLQPNYEIVCEQGQWCVKAPEGDHELDPVVESSEADASPAPSEPAGALQQIEPLREDVRLLYVGLTRAVYQVWLGATPSIPKEKGKLDWHRTALGHLVSGAGVTRHEDEIMADLKLAWQQLETSGSKVILETLEGSSALPVHRPMPQGAGKDWRPARRVTHPAASHWRLASYSAIAQGAGDALPPWRELRWDEQSAAASLVLAPTPAIEQAATDATVQDEGQAQGSWHKWPSSAAFGQLLHECLESGAEHSFDSHAHGSWCMDMQSRLRASPWAGQAGEIQAWLQQVVQRPLLPGGLALNGLRMMRAELEFWMPLRRLDTQALDRLLLLHVCPGQARPALRPQQVEGLMLGFADLVFESGGRYEVLDYKSNRLGPGPEHYTEASLRSAVLEHRYDVQAALYLLALHRLLQQRLGDRYELSQHLGAAHFLFLRGIDQAHGHLLSIEPDAAWLHPLDQMFEQAQALA